jgi:preprotein translocase subunit SecG
VAIAIAACVHALIYVILIRAEKSGGLKQSIKDTFKRDKKVEQSNINKFDD